MVQEISFVFKNIDDEASPGRRKSAYSGFRVSSHINKSGV